MTAEYRWKWQVEKATRGQREDLLLLKPAGRRIILVARKPWQDPFKRFPLLLEDTGPISIHYEIRSDHSALDRGDFTVQRKGDTQHAIPWVPAFEKMKEIFVWAEPYGHAALAYPEANEGRAVGRLKLGKKSPGRFHGDIFYEFQMLQSVVQFIVNQMNDDRHDSLVIDHRKFNKKGGKEFKERWEKLLELALKVRTGGGDWDYKEAIRPIWGTSNRLGHRGYTEHEDRVYYYDIYANVHFGFIGRAAGYTLELLQKGAGIQQLVDHLEDDPPEDKEMIRAGYSLFEKKEQEKVSASDFLDILDKHPNWQQREREKAKREREEAWKRKQQDEKDRRAMDPLPRGPKW
jgi:hypothetical protein